MNLNGINYFYIKCGFKKSIFLSLLFIIVTSLFLFSTLYSVVVVIAVIVVVIDVIVVVVVVYIWSSFSASSYLHRQDILVLQFTVQTI